MLGQASLLLVQRHKIDDRFDNISRESDVSGHELELKIAGAVFALTMILSLLYSYYTKYSAIVDSLGVPATAQTVGVVSDNLLLNGIGGAQIPTTELNVAELINELNQLGIEIPSLQTNLASAAIDPNQDAAPIAINLATQFKRQAEIYFMLYAAGQPNPFLQDFTDPKWNLTAAIGSIQQATTANPTNPELWRLLAIYAAEYGNQDLVDRANSNISMLTSEFES